MSKVIVSLREPATSEAIDRAVQLVQERFGGDADRIRARLAKPGVLARFGTSDRAESFAALLRGTGLQVEVLPEDGEFAWDVDGSQSPKSEPTGDSAQSAASPEVRAPRSGARAALIGALVCLVLGGLVAYYAPPLLIVFGPLFLAAFALSIVGIAQGNTLGGVLLLIAALIVGPAMSISGVARLLFPDLGAVTSSQPRSTGNATGEVSPLTTDGVPSSPPGDTETPSSNQVIDLQETYAQFIEVYEFEARRISTYLDENVAAIRFKLRNNGDRTVTRLSVTAYFRDAEDRVIFEDDFLVVSESAFLSDTPKLMRPGYIYQMESGNYFTSPNVPDEWEVGNAILQISAIELE